jgi:hypothetical protein
MGLATPAELNNLNHSKELRWQTQAKVRIDFKRFSSRLANRQLSEARETP